MHKRFCRLAVVLGLLILASQSSFAQPALSEPALSPDGKEIAFVSGGDIWVVPSSGGEAHLLVSDPATESRPLYSRDGKYLLLFLRARVTAISMYSVCNPAS